MYQNAVENVKNRLHQFIAAGGHRISDVILKNKYMRQHCVSNKKKIYLFSVSRKVFFFLKSLSKLDYLFRSTKYDFPTIIRAIGDYTHA